MVDEMNVLLGDARWHSLARRAEAEKRFARAVVRAFYDAVDPSASSAWDVRNQKLPLPGRSEGYATAMLIGPTGAGKTSLLRHLIGSDPDKDRFPSTSPNRTTIADTEVICADSNSYEAVVTFASEWSVYTNVHECVIAAASALWQQSTLSDEKVAERLMNHRDLRFRLSYILGAWAEESNVSASSPNDEGDPWAYETEEGAVGAGENEPELPPDFDPATAQTVLGGYVRRVRALTAEVLAVLWNDLGDDFEKLSADDETGQEWFEEALLSLSDFDDLVNDIIDEIRVRFDWLDADAVDRAPSGWPTSWHTTSSDRDAFLKAVRRFSSNYFPLFGTLLTPVVDGLRVRGPFFPKFTGLKPKIVFVDGEGLGHAKDSAAGVPIHITRRYAEVDVIILVDSAKTPMLEAPTSAIRSVVAAGYQKRLVFAFTHFDALRNQANLPSFRAQRAQVMNALNQALVSLRPIVPLPAVHALEREVDERSFILGFLDKPLGPQNRGPVAEMIRLIEFCERAIEPELVPTVRPVYDAIRLVLAIQGGTRQFHERWETLLSFRRSATVRTAHWAEVKALNRRVVLNIDDCEYRDLTPVPDLMGRLSETISKFLDSPDRWEPPAEDEVEKEQAIARVQRAVSTLLHIFVPERLIADPRARWVEAFDFRGYGSTSKRARLIQSIYTDAAPIPAEPLDEGAARFLREMRHLVHEAIEEAGGRLVSEVIG